MMTIVEALRANQIVFAGFSLAFISIILMVVIKLIPKKKISVLPAPFHAVVGVVENGVLVIEKRDDILLPTGASIGDKIMISNIIVPAHGTRGAREARSAMNHLLDGKKVSIYPHSRLAPRKISAQIFIGKTDIGTIMVAEGHAKSAGSIPLLRLERAARARKIGMWKINSHTDDHEKPAPKMTRAERRQKLLGL